MSPNGALSFDDALQAILSNTPAPRREAIPLLRANGRVLAEAMVSPVSLPPWDNAGMDGYAVRRADAMSASATSPVSLRVVGTVAAGADPSALPVVDEGTAVRIMTGAPVPPGADAVVRVEDTDGGTSTVMIRDTRDLAGRGNVRPSGEDVAKGEALFDAGTLIGPSHLGMLASIGAADVPVFAKPRVTVLSGGDELVLLDRFDEVLAGRRIVSSSSYALPALLGVAGAEVTTAPLMPDTLDGTMQAIEAAVSAGCDLLVTTGGVSVGAHDYTRDALVALGGAVDFWRARIRPGGPIGVGHVLGARWLGLPGNPVSTMVTASVFAWPLLRQLGGHRVSTLPRFTMRMMDAAPTPAPLTYFLRVTVARGADGEWEARLAGAQGSNLLRSMAMADGLLIVPEDRSAVQAGDRFDVVMLP